MLVAGIDIGSGTAKCVLVDARGEVRGRGLARTRADFEQVARDVLAAACADAGARPEAGPPGAAPEAVAYVATTGLGRYAVPFRDIQITDLTCGARGAATLFPTTRFVLDIGAQCSRAIRLREGGKVRDFHMNEKCAAGSGGFLERAARYLEVSLAEVGPLSLAASRPQTISSVCAVLAESEIINHVSEGVSVDNILRGIHDSLGDRALSLLRRVGLDGEVTLIGGVALQAGMVAALRARLGVPVHVPAEPQLTTALGAALLGLQRYRRRPAPVAAGGLPAAPTRPSSTAAA
jgi:predicted CoA-substrate-specific enzyme activase